MVSFVILISKLLKKKGTIGIISNCSKGLKKSINFKLF